jgi:hypothetical protein
MTRRERLRAQALRGRGVAAMRGRHVEKKKSKTGGLCATSAKEREQTRKKQGDGRKHAYQKISDNPEG